GAGVFNVGLLDRGHNQLGGVVELGGIDAWGLAVGPLVLGKELLGPGTGAVEDERDGGVDPVGVIARLLLLLFVAVLEQVGERAAAQVGTAQVGKFPFALAQPEDNIAGLAVGCHQQQNAIGGGGTLDDLIKRLFAPVAIGMVDPAIEHLPTRLLLLE